MKMMGLHNICVGNTSYVVAFGKAIQSLAKIGDELSIEPTLDGVSNF